MAHNVKFGLWICHQAYVVDNIIFGISVPDYPCITVETTFLRQFQLTFQMSTLATDKQTNNNCNLVMYVDKTSKTVIEFRIYKHVDIYKA